MSDIKVVVYVDGGNIQGMYSNNANMDIEVIDFDNLRAENKSSEERHSALKTATNGLHNIY